MSNAQFRMLLAWSMASAVCDILLVKHGCDAQRLLRVHALNDALRDISSLDISRVPPLTQKEATRYYRRIDKAAKPIKALHSEDHTVVALQFLNAVQLLVSDQARVTPDKDGRKQRWERVCELLQEEIESRDPDLSAYVEEGAALGERMQGVRA